MVQSKPLLNSSALSAFRAIRATCKRHMCICLVCKSCARTNIAWKDIVCAQAGHTYPCDRAKASANLVAGAARRATAAVSSLQASHAQSCWPTAATPAKGPRTSSVAYCTKASWRRDASPICAIAGVMHGGTAPSTCAFKHPPCTYGGCRYRQWFANICQRQPTAEKTGKWEVPWR